MAGPYEEAQALTLPGTSGEIGGSRQGGYRGYSVAETGGVASAKIILYDNATTASGAILEVITLSAGQSASDNYLSPGRLVLNGIYAQITGAVQGSVFQ